MGFSCGVAFRHGVIAGGTGRQPCCVGQQGSQNCPLAWQAMPLYCQAPSATALIEPTKGVVPAQCISKTVQRGRIVNHQNLNDVHLTVPTHIVRGQRLAEHGRYASPANIQLSDAVASRGLCLPQRTGHRQFGQCPGCSIASTTLTSSRKRSPISMTLA